MIHLCYKFHLHGLERICRWDDDILMEPMLVIGRLKEFADQTHYFKVAALIGSILRTWKRSFQMERRFVDKVNAYIGRLVILAICNQKCKPTRLTLGTSMYGYLQSLY